MVDDSAYGSPRPSDGYSPPPPTTPPASFPPPPGAGGYGGYGGHGGYGAAPMPFPGYPPTPYQGGQLPPPYPVYLPPGYMLAPQQDPRDRRPGTLTAAAVLGYVNAGLMILCGIILITGASLADDFARSVGDDQSALGAEFSVDAFFNLLAAGLLIGGGVAIGARSAVGRVVYSVGGVLVAALSLYWLLRFDDARRDGLIFYSLLFAAIPVVGLALAWVPGGTTWFANRRPDRDAPVTAA